MKNFKKLAMILLSVLLVFALVGCGDSKAPAEEAPADEAPAEFPEVMSYEEFMAADVDTPVTVETYVQAKQGWWEKDGKGVITLYTQNEDGAYFLYNAACSEEESEKLVPGTNLLVKGFKAEWSGEVDIIDAEFEIIDGRYVAEPEDLTEKFGTDEMADFLNQHVSFAGLTVEDKGDGQAFLYNYDGSGEKGDDLYFDVSLDGTTYTFVVESYLCGQDSDVYKAVEGLKVGDVIDVEGFMYWYEGAQLHTVSVTVK